MMTISPNRKVLTMNMAKVKQVALDLQKRPEGAPVDISETIALVAYLAATQHGSRSRR